MCSLIGWVLNGPSASAKVVQALLVLSNDNRYGPADGAGIMYGSSPQNLKSVKVFPMGNYDKINYMLSSIYLHMQETLDGMSTSWDKYGLGTSLLDLVRTGFTTSYNHIMGIGMERNVTAGSRDLSNVGPILSGNYIVCHNGTIKELTNNKDGSSDSVVFADIMNRVSLYEALNTLPSGNAVLFTDVNQNEPHLMLYVNNKDINVYSIIEHDKVIGTIVSSQYISDGMIKLLCPELDIKLINIKDRILYVIKHDGIYKKFSHKETENPDLFKYDASVIRKHANLNTSVDYNKLSFRNTRFWYNGNPVTSDPFTLEYCYWIETSFGLVPVHNIDNVRYVGTNKYTGEIVLLEKAKMYLFYNGVAVESMSDLEELHQLMEQSQIDSLGVYVPYTKYPLWVGAFNEESNSNKCVYRDPIVEITIRISETDDVMTIKNNHIINIKHANKNPYNVNI